MLHSVVDEMHNDVHLAGVSRVEMQQSSGVASHPHPDAKPLTRPDAHNTLSLVSEAWWALQPV